MSSREKAIEDVLAGGIPIHKGHIHEVLRVAHEAGHVHFDDECTTVRSKTRLRNALRAKRQADEQTANVVAQRDELRELLGDVAQSGVAFEDSRVKYVEVQIDVDTWERLQELVSSPNDKETTEQ